MAANKVIVNNQTILDLTADTVTAATLKKGVTAHDASGTQITGTMESGGGGSTSETWVLDSAAAFPDSNSATFNAVFTSNGLSFSSITLSGNFRRQIRYDSTVVKSFDSWASEAYRKLTFTTAPTGDLLTWLTANGVKQPANLAVQPSKDVTITSNGTTEITPDAPYDALKKVNLTANVVADVPLVTVTFKATQFGDEINSPGEDTFDEMQRIVVSAFVDGNISLDDMYDFSNQWGGMVFPFDVAVPQGSSVTICDNSAFGGGVSATNALVASTSANGIKSVYTIYNITDGATITIDVS